MLTYGGYHGTGVDEGVVGLVGVVVVDSSAGGIPACKSVTGCGVSAVRHRLIELTVRDSCEGSVLIDDPGEGIRE